MTQPLKKYIFRPIEGIWRNISGNSEILADVLKRYRLEIDERTEYARIFDYIKGEKYIYHAQALKIDLEVWTLE